MDDQDLEASSENRLDQTRLCTSTGELDRQGSVNVPSDALLQLTRRHVTVDAPIPSRMLNEFVYCRRLFYYEFVEDVFVDSSDTMRGAAIHKRVDSGKGALPKAKRKTKADTSKEKVGERVESENEQSPPPQEKEPETIHSRSVTMGSERLGVVAKMDLVEVRAELTDGGGDLFAALNVCPVDYKAGAPKEGEDANELWDTDKMQLGLQALILRDNGYTCREGVIYYHATKQRVRLPITSELESWILDNRTDPGSIGKFPEVRALFTSPGLSS